MKTLIVDDELFGRIGRIMMRKLLCDTGACDMAVNGIEAMEAFRMAWEENSPYDLVCLDLMMPGMDGHETLKALRAYEEQRGIFGEKRAKVIIISAKEDSKSVLSSFREGCEGYLVKPITKNAVDAQLKELGLKD
ncbi:MAG: response regulator [Nitrospinae bacterium]|nr:response regulator [Nitrospinota bacterium]